MKAMYLILIGLSIAFSACEKDQPQAQQISNTLLTEEEKSSLIFMREEEKLAHDVYTTLYAKWNLMIFNSISNSEQTHTDAILLLLNKYGLTDPVGSNDIGEFSDTLFTRLYQELVLAGNASLLDALKVGATIEDLDLVDLRNALSQLSNADMIATYQNLSKGSRNHLRSFYSKILSEGGDYTPQFLSQEEFDAIINSPKETGGM